MLKKVKSKRAIYTSGGIIAVIIAAMHLYFYFLNRNTLGVQLAIALAVGAMCAYDVLTEEHIIPRTLTISLALYGIAVHIIHPFFFILPVALDIVLLILFARAGFGMGDFKAFVALSFLMPNNEFFWLYMATFIIAAIFGIFAVVRKKTFSTVKKAILSISGILVYDEEREGMPFMPFVLFGYVAVVIVNAFHRLW